MEAADWEFTAAITVNAVSGATVIAAVGINGPAVYSNYQALLRRQVCFYALCIRCTLVTHDYLTCLLGFDHVPV